jgi:hypothetical protein
MNKHKTNTNGNTRLIPFHLIETAVSGDVDAINKVLKHYEGYIIALSTRRLFDEDGNTHYFVDSEVRRTLETKLITKILQFDLTRIA